MIPATIVGLDASRVPALRSFLDGLPERDLTFIKEDVTDPAVVESWARDGGRARHWVAVDDAGVLALLSLVPLPGWSSHVGDLRLVVDPAARAQGLGRMLARHALHEAIEAGLHKVVVEVVAEHEGAVRMFTELGFHGEALLTDHIRDRSGELRDLLLLAHDADEEWSVMSSLGVDGDLG